MQAFKEFSEKDASFWAFIKLISEALGYTEGKKENKLVKFYTIDEISTLCTKLGMPIIQETIREASLYSKMRADTLNQVVKMMLMDGESARHKFEELYHSVYVKDQLKCLLPMNKQKGDKKQIAFFTAIINILTEQTIRKMTGDTSKKGFNDNPQALFYVLDEKRNLVGTSSRRFDGAFPGIVSPLLVWEIKEYYYTTTFGSRIADGVFETQLDGFEMKELYSRTGKKVHHVLFIDAYNTWWNMGKSYLCRIIDALNYGLVDEVIVGREVFSRWPEVLYSVQQK